MDLSTNCLICDKPFEIGMTIKSMTHTALGAMCYSWCCKSHTEPKAAPVDDMPEDREFYYNLRAEERWA